MNKGIIVVLVLLLLAGAVIAGIVLTRKSKYTKDTNVPGGAALVANECQTKCTSTACSNSECCPPDEICTKGTQDPPKDSKLNKPCDSDEECDVTDDQACILGADGNKYCYFNPLDGGPPGKGCICWGRGTCGQENEGCICDAGLDPALRCKACKGDATWDSEAQKCVAPPPIVCKNGGTPKTDGKSCSCPSGFRDDCGCVDVPMPKPVDTTGAKGGSCMQMLVCPYGEGTSLTLDKCTHGEPTKRADGCYVIDQGFWGIYGPDCEFTSTSKTGTETHQIRQDFCGASAGTITAENITYESPGGTCVSPDSGSDGTYGTTCTRGKVGQDGGMNYGILMGDDGHNYAGQVYIGPKMVCDGTIATCEGCIN